MKEIPLGHCCVEIRNGKSIKQDDALGGFPITRIETISNRVVNPSKVGYAGLSNIDDVEEYVMKKGDLLMSHINSPKHLGKSAFYDGSPSPLVHGMNLLRLRVNVTTCFPKYLWFWTQSLHFKAAIEKISNQSVNQASFSVTSLRKVLVPLPPLEEQKRIAGILDEADQLRKKTQALIDKYDELAQSLFLDMFGDPGCNESTGFHELGEFCSQITDGDHATPKRESSGHKLLSCRNVKMNHLDFEAGLDFVGEEEFLRMSKRCLAESGDVLISCSGTIGRTLVVQGSEKFVMVRSAALVRVKSQLLDADYLARYLQTPYMQAVMKKRANASSQANLFIGQIKKLPLVVPEIEDQRKFGERIRKMEVLKSDAQVVVQTETALFNALLQKAFKGELK